LEHPVTLSQLSEKAVTKEDRVAIRCAIEVLGPAASVNTLKQHGLARAMQNCRGISIATAYVYAARARALADLKSDYRKRGRNK